MFVRADGSTESGWGAPRKTYRGFPYNYRLDRFTLARAELHEKRTGQPTALVMRSLKLICVDIDGKSGGWEGVKALGYLPPTLAEISKSQNGRHLFYRVDDAWDPALGFAAFQDFTRIAQGVDIRSVGLVYHYPDRQRWNELPVAAAPPNLVNLLQRKAEHLAHYRVKLEKGEVSRDEIPTLLKIADIRDRLQEPIPEGFRNTTLFALACSMIEIDYQNWEQELAAKAEEVGIDEEEFGKIVQSAYRRVG